MPWAAAAAVVAAGVSYAASENAEDAQYASGERAREQQQGQYNQTRSDQNQFMHTGRSANARLAELLGQGVSSRYNADKYGSLMKKFDQNDLNSDVVYNTGLKFGLDQGNAAINQRALQSGSYDSGATLKALTQYANDYGSTKANDAYNRYNVDQSNWFNRLSAVSGTGQQPTNQVQAAGTNMANNVGNYMLDQGNAAAAGKIAQGNSINKGISSLFGSYQ